MIADSPLSNFRFEEHDSLFIPNGILGVDQLRQSPALQRIVHQFFKRNLIVAVVGHAVSVLADEGLLEDRKVAAPTSLKQAIIDSGGIYNDQDVVRDQNLLTSTGPEVMDQFNHYLMIQLSVARATEEKSRIANR
jgi:protease I